MRRNAKRLERRGKVRGTTETLDKAVDIAVLGAGCAGLSAVVHLLREVRRRGVPCPRIAICDNKTGFADDRSWCGWQVESHPFVEEVTHRWHRWEVRHAHAQLRKGSVQDGRVLTMQSETLPYTYLPSHAFYRRALREISTHAEVQMYLGATLNGIEHRGAGDASVAVLTFDYDMRPCVVSPSGTVAGGASSLRGNLLGDKTVGSAEESHAAPKRSGRTLRARWVWDARPPTDTQLRSCAFKQHFRGWFVRTPEPCFDPTTVRLMDFLPSLLPSADGDAGSAGSDERLWSGRMRAALRRPLQARLSPLVSEPASDRHGVHFMYVLPFSRHEALVEDTWFSKHPLPQEAYDSEIRRYLSREGVLDAEVTRVEQGVLPMDVHFGVEEGAEARRGAARVLRLGVAAGLARPSTGYAFAAIQRHSAALAEWWLSGHAPSEIPDPSRLPVRHAKVRVMDAVFLSFLQRHPDRAADMFWRIASTLSPESFARFLSEASQPIEDMKVLMAVPRAPFLGAAIDAYRDALLRRT